MWNLTINWFVLHSYNAHIFIFHLSISYRVSNTKYIIITRNNYSKLQVKKKLLLFFKQTKDYPEEGHGTSAIQGAIRDVCLTGEILRIFDRSYHPFHGKKRRQVGRVRGYDDQCEKPPYATHDSRARCLNKFIKNLIFLYHSVLISLSIEISCSSVLKLYQEIVAKKLESKLWHVLAIKILHFHVEYYYVRIMASTPYRTTSLINSRQRSFLSRFHYHFGTIQFL